MDGLTELLAGRLIDVCFRFRDPDSLPLLRLLHPSSLPASPFRTHTCMKTKMGLIRTGQTGKLGRASCQGRTSLPVQWSYTESVNFLGSEVDCAQPSRRRREKNLEPQKIDGHSTFEQIQIQQKLSTGEENLIRVSVRKRALEKYVY